MTNATSTGKKSKLTIRAITQAGLSGKTLWQNSQRKFSSLKGSFENDHLPPVLLIVSCLSFLLFSSSPSPATFAASLLFVEYWARLGKGEM